MIRGHGGNIHELAFRLGCDPDAIDDMSSNVNPIGPMPELMDCLHIKLERIRALPEVDAAAMTAAFARTCGLLPEQVLAGNGSTEILYLLPRALGPRRAVILGPTYADYADACRLAAVPVHHVLAGPQDSFRPPMDRLAADLEKGDLVFICNPNNPTGSLIDDSTLLDLAAAHPGCIFLIDESYLPFVGAAPSLAGRGSSNLLVLSSLSKIHRIPGLRIGFVAGAPDLIERLAALRIPWSVNALAQAAVEFIGDQPQAVAAFVEQTRRFLEAERGHFFKRLAGMAQIRAFDSGTSFILARLHPPFAANGICQALAQERILIRNAANFVGLGPEYVRFSLKKRTVNDRALDCLTALLKGLSP